VRLGPIAGLLVLMLSLVVGALCQDSPKKGVAIFSYSTKPTNNTKYWLTQLGVGYFPLHTPNGSTTYANISWGPLGVSRNYPTLSFDASLHDFYVDSLSAQNPPRPTSGLCFALVKLTCYGQAAVCDRWRAEQGNWQYIMIRYKYGDVYVEPTVVNSVQLPDTLRFAEFQTHALIATPDTIFVFDYSTKLLIRYQVASDFSSAKVVSAVGAPMPIGYTKDWHLDMKPFITGGYLVYYSAQLTFVRYNFGIDEWKETPFAKAYVPTGSTSFLPDTGIGYSDYLIMNWTMDRQNITHVLIGRASATDTDPPWMQISADCPAWPASKEMLCQLLRVRQLGYDGSDVYSWEFERNTAKKTSGGRVNVYSYREGTLKKTFTVNSWTNPPYSDPKNPFWDMKSFRFG